MASAFLTRLSVSTAVGYLLAGCGGGGGPAPALGSGLTVNVRAINLAQGAPPMTVYNGPYGATLGTVAQGQATPYTSESGGSGQVSFVNSGQTVATYTGQLLDSTYDTVVLYSVNGNYETFALQDNGGATAIGRSQLRIANAVSVLNGDIDVFLAPGAHTSPVTAGQYLITPNGLALGQATSYHVVTPGTYTVSVVSALDQAALVLNQVVTLSGGQASTLYVGNNQTATQIPDDQ